MYFCWFKFRLLVPPSYTLVQLKNDLRKTYKVKPEEGLFIFVESTQLMEAMLSIGEVYEKVKEERKKKDKDVNHPLELKVTLT